MKKIRIEGEDFLRWVADEKEFAQILEEKLGYEAAELFREYIKNYHCGIAVALEALDQIHTNSDSINAALDEAKDALEGVMW